MMLLLQREGGHLRQAAHCLVVDRQVSLPAAALLAVYCEDVLSSPVNQKHSWLFTMH